MSLFREAVDLGYKKFVYPKIIAGSEQDREVAHENGLKILEALEQDGLKGKLLRQIAYEIFSYYDPRLETEAFGVKFPNPIGVAAGLDKNGRVFRALGVLGFGHIDVGSATLLPFAGNPRPRIFYHQSDGSLTNRMGFPGDGLETVLARLDYNLLPRENRDYVVSLNIGGSKPSFEQGKALDHYAESFAAAEKTRADYIVVNISSPNTEGVRGLQDPVVTDELLSRFAGAKKPYLIKLGPDLPQLQYRNLAEIAKKRGASGMVLTNTSTDPSIKEDLTSSHKKEIGGVSGLALQSKATGVRLENALMLKDLGLDLISVGGLQGALDDWNAISFEGAVATERLTALIHEDTSSPNFAYSHCATLIKWMDRAQIQDLTELRYSRQPRPLSRKRRYT